MKNSLKSQRRRRKYDCLAVTKVLSCLSPSSSYGMTRIRQPQAMLSHLNARRARDIDYRAGFDILHDVSLYPRGLAKRRDEHARNVECLNKSNGMGAERAAEFVHLTVNGLGFGRSDVTFFQVE